MLSLAIMAISLYMIGKRQRHWLSTKQMKVGLLLVVLTNTWPGITRDQIKSCTDRPAYKPLFNIDFTLPELTYALQNLDTNKSPEPDSVHGHFLSHLEILGTPQGCVLIPTLFLLFITGIEKYVNPSQVGLFVDDVVLWCSNANMSKREFHLNRSLVNIQEFANIHKITFNASKSTVSLLTTNRHLHNYSPELFLMSQRLKYSKYSTYLGFTLDPEVNWGKLIEKLADKAKKRLTISFWQTGIQTPPPLEYLI
ncbi:putative RNA-directed DNA polymerase from transposon BS [Trichonephila inaurata madagascariensis]|uniref:Putative RNA-directed DNA polymerase from transposon BS n=1 Tax=Trichonephila inaurata madagascariensis TaxID=2747483 RepID=A0A8X6X926_9ARAC|nr:putative RNA-directed DNA polymerase from transposon BS [Trichonephila inaurata madagascariensis]GFY60538.1 putative RNA-directed DNA polymerase from transposon BS [Trichonephila inaurata madagascariensis]